MNPFSKNDLIHQSPAIVFIADMETRNIQWCNKTMENILSYSLEEMQQMGDTLFRSIMHPEDYPNALKARSLFITGEIKHISFGRFKGKKDKDWRWFYGITRIYEQDEAHNVKTLICSLLEFEEADTPVQMKTAFYHSLHICNQSVWRDLSERQIAVLRLMKEGYKAPVIAQRLFVSYETVKRDLKKLYEKFHVHTAAALVALAIEMGL
jgi:DNA-binding CsgD family transcriptional regulator